MHGLLEEQPGTSTTSLRLAGGLILAGGLGSLTHEFGVVTYGQSLPCPASAVPSAACRPGAYPPQPVL